MKKSETLDATYSLLSRFLPVRTLDRYVIRQFTFAYLVCGTSIIGLFMVLEGLSKLGKFLNQDKNVILVLFHYFMATLPVYFSQYLAPVLTLIAAMFTVTLLNRSREIVPMKAAGISVARILAPFFLLATLFAGAQIGIQELILPNCKDLIRKGTSYGKKKGTIRPDAVKDSARNNLSIEVEMYDPQRKRGFGVEVYERHASHTSEGDVKRYGYRKIFHATDIVWNEETERWELREGWFHEWKPDGSPVIFSVNGTETNDDVTTTLVRHFDNYELDTRIRPIDFESSDRDIPYLSYAELLGQYRRYTNRRHLEVKLHQRFAFPLANLILLLLGLPYVMRSNRSVLIGVLVAIGIAAAYMLSTTICADLGNKGQLPPAVAAWLPVLFFGALGFTLFDGMES